MEEKVRDALSREDYGKALEELSVLAPVIDRLFDDVLIMCEEEEVRENRLSLINRTTKLFMEIADFTKMAWD